MLRWRCYLPAPPSTNSSLVFQPHPTRVRTAIRRSNNKLPADRVARIRFSCKLIKLQGERSCRHLYSSGVTPRMGSPRKFCAIMCIISLARPRVSWMQQIQQQQKSRSNNGNCNTTVMGRRCGRCHDRDNGP